MADEEIAALRLCRVEFGLLTGQFPRRLKSFETMKARSTHFYECYYYRGLVISACINNVSCR